VGLLVLPNICAYYITGLRVKDEIRGAGRYSHILLK
jgi:hypothetical protein